MRRFARARGGFYAGTVAAGAAATRATRPAGRNHSDSAFVTKDIPMTLPLLLLVLAAALCMAPRALADPFDGAEWLRDPVFAGRAPRDFNAIDPAALPTDRPMNTHTYLRRTFRVEGAPAWARLRFSADDYAKVWLNGAFVAQGPEPGFPFDYPYYDVDIAPFLRAGENCVAAHVYYQGLYNRVWVSADDRSGFVAALHGDCEDGTPLRLVTDATWRLWQSATWATDRTIGYDTQFAEDIDLRAEPVGWRLAGFDDGGWRAPLLERQDHAFAPSATPPLTVRRVSPVSMRRTGPGRWLCDFGTEVTGHTGLRLRGPRGHRVELRHGEELAGPDAVRYEMRCNCIYQEFVTLSGGDDAVTQFDYKGFRYVEVLDAPEEPAVWVDVRHHPYDPAAAWFDATASGEEALLPRVWTLCANGVRYGTQGGFLDCPTREKGQYLGDCLVTARSHLVLTGDGSVTRNALKAFQQTQRFDSGMLCVAPSTYRQSFAEYSLQWPMLLETYHDYTGDRAFTRAMASAGFEPLFGWFETFESADGVLARMEKPVLVDWPQNLRDGYDDADLQERPVTVLNAWYHAGLSAAARVARAVGLDPAPYAEKAARLREAFVAAFYDRERGLFVDAAGSTHASLHANALPLAFGLAPDEAVAGVAAFVRGKGLACGVFIAPFVIEGLFRHGFGEAALDLLLSRGEHSWAEMLRHGATTCLEAWGPDQKWNTSFCHPWSSSPVYLTSEYVMGLRPAEPGWGRVRFRPHRPALWTRASLVMPTVRGPLRVDYAEGEGYTVTAPEDVEVEVDTGEQTEVRHADTSAPLSDEQREFLERYDWEERVGDGAAIWVSVPEQRLRLIRGGRVVWERLCATAAKGVGQQLGSNRTPVGWHSVRAKIGDGAPWGQVFRARGRTGEVWEPGDDTSEDLVLTRILWLDGEEPGFNRGGEVDSATRYIYIHGTNDEAAVGTPSSHGCVRLRNDDVIALYERVGEGTPVLITADGPERAE